MIQFYQSPSDKARFDVLLKVLSEETPNLAIIGEDELARGEVALKNLREEGQDQSLRKLAEVASWAHELRNA